MKLGWAARTSLYCHRKRGSYDR